MKNNFYRSGDMIFEIRHEDNSKVFELYEYDKDGDQKAYIKFDNVKDDREILDSLSVLTKESFCKNYDIEYALNRDNFRRPFAELVAAAKSDG